MVGEHTVRNAVGFIQSKGIEMLVRRGLAIGLSNTN